MSTLGLASYPVYLFHGPLLMFVGSWIYEVGRDHRLAGDVRWFCWPWAWRSGPPLGLAAGAAGDGLEGGDAAAVEAGRAARGVPGRSAPVTRPCAVGAGVHS